MSARKKNLEYIRAVSEFFSEFASITTLMELDAARCVEKLSSMPRFNILGFLEYINTDFYPGCNFRELWISSVTECKELPFYNENVQELLLSFADVFGKYSIDEFSGKCTEYSLKTADLYNSEKEKWEKNRSLHAGAGILAAAAVFIIFI